MGAALTDLFGLNAPLPVLLWGFMLGWGFFGFWSNQLVKPPLGLAMLLAGIGGLLLARGAAALAARMIPPDETSVVSREQLLGLVGEAVYPVTETTGRLHVYDAFGTLHEELCRLERGQDPIDKGSRILLIDYDDQRRLYLVERVP